ncbi:aspartate carbamoyltransferase regulatory subunit [Escherichia coli]|nr:aspartate carbamoyltransferase regulatory subunit [Escherichia coli]
MTHDNKLQVEAIKRGTVIDHIPAQIGFKLLSLFKLTETDQRIDNVLVCPNSNCISHAEPVSSSFAVRKRANDIALKCKYCEKEFSHNVVLAN